MRVLIVDDHQRYAEVMAEYVRRGGHTPMRRATLKGAIDAVSRYEVGTVYVPPSLRGKSTRALVDYITEHQPDTRVFMLVENDDGDQHDPVLAGLAVSGVRHRREVSSADAATGLRSN